VSGWIALDLHRDDLSTRLKHRASDIVGTLESATWAAMLENDEQQLHHITENATRDRRVRVLRVISADGEIRHSSNPQEVGTIADLSQPTCQHCHATDPSIAPAPVQPGFRAYDRTAEEHVIGVVAPVLNSKECWSAGCHVHDRDQSVLGMLEVELSTRDMEASLASERRSYILLWSLTLFFVTAVPGLLAWRMVHRPFRRLVQATDAIGRGDLETRIEGDYHGELGDMASSINEMADGLRAAHAELRMWNEELERRVAEKSEEVERAQQHLVFTEKMASLGQLAAVVAHEINNPLGGILVSVKLLRRRLARLLEEGEDRDSIDETLQMVEHETARSGDIVRNLLLFSRQGAVQAKWTDLRALVERCRLLVSHKAELSEVTITTSVQEGLADIECDANKIEQALLALVLNALDAAPEGGHVSIEVAETRGGVQISVADDGPGIPEEIRDRLYEPFVTTKSEGQGTGLGLSVMYGIVRSHGGRVDFESSAEEGTRFRITLPRTQNPTSTDPETVVEEKET
jgi:two-component system NtrC family sensor kinase